MSEPIVEVEARVTVNTRTGPQQRIARLQKQTIVTGIRYDAEAGCFQVQSADVFVLAGDLEEITPQWMEMEGGQTVECGANDPLETVSHHT